MTTATTAQEAVQAILAAEPVHETRFIDTINVGQYARQGDIYIVAINQIPEGAKPTANRQLAPGATQGSRHTVDESVYVFNPANLGQKVTTKFGSAFAGPCIQCDTFALISHPEHADISVPPGLYQILGQYDPSTDRRVAD